MKKSTIDNIFTLIFLLFVMEMVLIGVLFYKTFLETIDYILDEPTLMIEPSPSAYQYEKQSNVIASWYDWGHCLGCNTERRMANGEILVDNAGTVAFNEADKNTNVLVCSLNISECAVMRVTDRMGIPGRIDIAGHETFMKFNEAGNGNGGLVPVTVFYN